MPPAYVPHIPAYRQPRQGLTQLPQATNLYPDYYEERSVSVRDYFVQFKELAVFSVLHTFLCQILSETVAHRPVAGDRAVEAKLFSLLQILPQHRSNDSLTFLSL